MPSVKVNFADVPDQRSFEPIPPADYHMMVTGVTHGEIKNGDNKGAPRINWELTVQSGEYENRKVFDAHNLVQNQLWKPKALLTAAGVEFSEGEFEFDPEDLVGVEVVAKVDIQRGNKDENTGQQYKDRNNVKGYFPYEEDDSDLVA